MGNFYSRVYDVVNKIPHGMVATYQCIARLSQSPRAAQSVGNALRYAFSKRIDVSWHRVLRSNGTLSPRAPKRQQVELLRKEDIEVKEVDGSYSVDLKEYRWRSCEK